MAKDIGKHLRKRVNYEMKYMYLDAALNPDMNHFDFVKEQLGNSVAQSVYSLKTDGDLLHKKSKELAEKFTHAATTLLIKDMKKAGVPADMFKSKEFKKGVKDTAKMMGELEGNNLKLEKFIIDTTMSVVGGKALSNMKSKDLSQMSTEELLSRGYVRVPGFTRKDGTKVKSHIRKLR